MMKTGWFGPLVGLLVGAGCDGGDDTVPRDVGAVECPQELTVGGSPPSADWLFSAIEGWPLRYTITWVNLDVDVEVLEAPSGLVFTSNYEGPGRRWRSILEWTPSFEISGLYDHRIVTVTLVAPECPETRPARIPILVVNDEDQDGNAGCRSMLPEDRPATRLLSSPENGPWSGWVGDACDGVPVNDGRTGSFMVVYEASQRSDFCLPDCVPAPLFPTSERDVVLGFTPTRSGTYDVHITNYVPGGEVGLAVMAECGDAADQCLAGSRPPRVSVDLEAGVTVFFVVDGLPTSGSTFHIDIHQVEPEDR